MRKRSLSRQAGTKRDWAGWASSYVMVLPAMIFFVIFYIYPMLNLIQLSFYKGNVRNPYKQFMGMDNYIKLFTTQPDYVPALQHTAYYTIVVLVLLISLSLLFAVWLQKSSKVNDFVQSAIFSPHIVAAISCAYIWSWMYNSEAYGLFNTILKLFGIARVRWLDQTSTAMNCVIIMNVWKSVGYYSLILMSALRAIPAEIYEAAELDSASPFQKFFKITLPMLSPQLFFLLITITTGSFKVFDAVRLMTGGGPGKSTEVLSLWIYQNAFQNNNALGLGAAGGVILLLILMLVTLLDFKGLERKVHYQ